MWQLNSSPRIEYPPLPPIAGEEWKLYVNELNVMYERNPEQKEDRRRIQERSSLYFLF
jgi:hypothetical protein